MVIFFCFLYWGKYVEVVYPALVASIGLVLLMLILIGALIWNKRRAKNEEEKPTQASSILIYPYQHGSPPQFL